MRFVTKKDVVVGYPFTEIDVLAGKRKTAPWLKKIMGAGGKIEKGEEHYPAYAQQREFMEELGIWVEIGDLEQVAEFQLFTVGRDVTVRRKLIVFKTLRWENEPVETAAMKPCFVPKNKIRSYFPEMLSGDGTWLSFVLSGYKMLGEIHRHDDGRIIKVQFKLVNEFQGLLY